MDEEDTIDSLKEKVRLLESYIDSLHYELGKGEIAIMQLKDKFRQDRMAYSCKKCNYRNPQICGCN